MLSSSSPLEHPGLTEEEGSRRRCSCFRRRLRGPLTSPPPPNAASSAPPSASPNPILVTRLEVSAWGKEGETYSLATVPRIRPIDAIDPLETKGRIAAFRMAHKPNYPGAYYESVHTALFSGKKTLSLQSLYSCSFGVSINLSAEMSNWYGRARTSILH